jgi:putative ABC transport system ATP-binding protein
METVSMANQIQKVLSIQNLHKKYNPGKHNEVNVLKGIQLEMDSGNFFALMGPSGCGKSTLLNLVGGLTSITEGKILVNGIDLNTLNDDSLSEFRNKQIGWVFQSFGLINNLTALENVMIPLNLALVEDEIAVKRAKELLEMVGLGDRMEHFPDGLSGGQQQRVAIARALANDPKLILADEPTGNLDTNAGREIIELFKDLATKGKTILMVTHDIALAHASHKVFILKNGVVAEETETNGTK